MSQEDGESISEDEMDEIVNRVVDQLREADVGEGADGPAEEHEIEVRDAADEEPGAAGEGDHGGPQDAREEARREAREARERAQRDARRAREEAHREAREAAEQARRDAAGAREFDDLGESIEAAVEASLGRVADSIERSFGPGAPPDPPTPGVVVGPDDAREKAVYKTQLQKGGRVAVPDTEIEALDLEPGDTLQVVLYPVD